MNTSTDRRLAWFGKLPCAGDFTSHAMPAEFLSLLDDWLCLLIHQGGQQHAHKWLQAYFNMPVQGFILNTRAMQATGDDVVGVWMPSVDRAGRPFPFLLMEFLPQGTCQGLSGDVLTDWFLKAAGLCAEALMDEWEMERLGTAIRQLPEVSPGGPCPVGNILQVEKSDWYRIDGEKSVIWMMQSRGLPSSIEFNTLLGLKAGS